MILGNDIGLKSTNTTICNNDLPGHLIFLRNFLEEDGLDEDWES